MMERRELEAVIYEREPPIARIILNRPDKANTKDATLVEEVDACLHEADRDKEIKVVILKANGKGFCAGHVARWGPDENPYPDFGNTFEDLYKGTADLFLWPTLYLWEFPKPPSPRSMATAWGRHLPRPADRLLCRVGRRVFPDAAGAQPG
jgi:enoyl-CoA hydratase